MKKILFICLNLLTFNALFSLPECPQATVENCGGHACPAGEKCCTLSVGGAPFKCETTLPNGKKIIKSAARNHVACMAQCPRTHFSK